MESNSLKEKKMRYHRLREHLESALDSPEGRAAEEEYLGPYCLGTQLHLAAIRGDEDLVKGLLASGATDRPDFTGCTAVYHAAMRGNESIVRHLAASSAHIDTQADDGSTALIQAAYVATQDESPALIDCVSALSELGADLTLRDVWGKCAKDYCWGIPKLERAVGISRVLSDTRGAQTNCNDWPRSLQTQTHDAQSDGAPSSCCLIRKTGLFAHCKDEAAWELKLDDRFNMIKTIGDFIREDVVSVGDFIEMVEKQIIESESVPMIDDVDIDPRLLQAIHVPTHLPAISRTILFGRNGMVHLGEHLAYAGKWHRIKNQWLQVCPTTGKMLKWDSYDEEVELLDLEMIKGQDEDDWFLSLVANVRARLFLESVYAERTGRQNPDPRMLRKTFCAYFMEKFDRFIHVVKEAQNALAREDCVDAPAATPYIQRTCLLCGELASDSHLSSWIHQKSVEKLKYYAQQPGCTYCGSAKWSGCPYKAACRQCCWCKVPMRD